MSAATATLNITHAYSGRKGSFAKGNSLRRQGTRMTIRARRGDALQCDAKLGIVGGSNLTHSQLFSHLEKKAVSTEHGNVYIWDSQPEDEKQIAFVRRHYCGVDDDEGYVPPHMVKSPAFIKAFKELGVTEVLIVCSVGSLRKGLIPPHSVIFPDDYLSFWNTATYAKDDKSGELLPEISGVGREAGLEAVRSMDSNLHLVDSEAVYVQTRGPRFETKAEIKALGMMGCDVVGMTGITEIVLCNELRMPVTMVCFCDNYANGVNKDDEGSLDAYNEFYANVASNLESVENVVGAVIDNLLVKGATADQASAAEGTTTTTVGGGSHEVSHDNTEKAAPAR